MRKKLLALSLILTMVMTMLPIGSMTAFAADVPQENSPEIIPNIGHVNGSVVDFAGQEWYVIGHNGEGVYSNKDEKALTLLLKMDEAPVPESVYASTVFRETSPGPTEGYDEFRGRYFKVPFNEPWDYSGSDLLNKMDEIYQSYTQEEQKVIEKRDIIDGIAGAAVTGQNLWPLSVAEAKTIASEDLDNTPLLYAGNWWLRSQGEEKDPYIYSDRASTVTSGSIIPEGNFVGHEGLPRPAFKLDTSKVIFMSKVTRDKANDENFVQNNGTVLNLRFKNDTVLSNTNAGVNGIVGESIISYTAPEQSRLVVELNDGTNDYVMKKEISSAVNGLQLDLSVNSGLVDGTYTGKAWIEKREDATNEKGLIYATNPTRVEFKIGESDNANLSALSLSSGVLNPEFASSTKEYTASVSNNVESIAVTPTAEDSKATIKVNESAVVSGTPSGDIPLSVGANTITIEVTAEDNTTKNIYTVIVTREEEVDNTAPELKEGVVERKSDTEATVKFTSNEAGTYFYKIGEQVIDTTGAGIECDTQEQTITLNELTKGAKDIFIRVKDKANNVSSIDFKIAIPEFVSNKANVSYNLSNIQGVTVPSEVGFNENLEVKLSETNEYALPSRITVEMGGKTLLANEYNYSRYTGEIIVENVTGNVVITATGATKGTAPTIDPDTSVKDPVIVTPTPGEGKVFRIVHEMLTEEDINMAKNNLNVTENAILNFSEIELQVSIDNGETWKKATKEDFEGANVKLFMAYPDGTDSTTHSFEIHHFASGVAEAATALRTTSNDSICAASAEVSEFSPFAIVAEPKGTSGGGGSTGGGGISSYTITATAEEGGSISPEGKISVNKGNNKKFKITALEGYEIADILVDGESVGANSTYTFENVEKNHTINVKFVEEGLMGEKHQAYIRGYADGTIRPENNITRAEVASIIFQLMSEEDKEKYFTTTNKFIDVSGSSWYNEAVSTVANAGIVTGYEDGTFRGDDFITRGEFTVMASSYDSDNAFVGDNKFSDVAGHWASDYINRVSSKGWIYGYPDGTFKPDKYITRGEVISIINQILGRGKVGKMDDNMKLWPDNNKNAWYYKAVQEATNDHSCTRDVDGYENWTSLKDGEK